MDDGNFHGSSVRIATNCFNYKEHISLIKILQDKYKIEASIHKNHLNYLSLYIKKKSLPQLKELVLPYFHSSMYYKLGFK